MVNHGDESHGRKGKHHLEHTTKTRNPFNLLRFTCKTHKEKVTQTSSPLTGVDGHGDESHGIESIKIRHQNKSKSSRIPTKKTPHFPQKPVKHLSACVEKIMGPCHSVTFKVLFVLHAYFFFGMCYLQHKYTTPCVELLYLKNLKQPTRVPIEHLLISFPQNAKKILYGWGIQILKPIRRIIYRLDLRSAFLTKKNRPYFP